MADGKERSHGGVKAEGLYAAAKRNCGAQANLKSIMHYLGIYLECILLESSSSIGVLCMSSAPFSVMR
jgi:hypothetical protein